MSFIGPSTLTLYTRALGDGIIPQHDMDRYDKGETIPFKSGYGVSYFSKEIHWETKEWAVDLSKPVPVRKGSISMIKWFDDSIQF